MVQLEHDKDIIACIVRVAPHKRVGVVFFPKYQRFTEDQRLLENMGLIEKSSVTAYLEEYYEKHPLDNSYEGILARRSGLTKEQVVAYLDKLDYLAKVVDYDPTNKAPILNKRHRSHIDSM